MAVKKRKVRARPKTGLSAAPLDDFYKLKFYFHYELDRKELSSLIKGYIRNHFARDDQKNILANPEYHFFMHAHFAACVYWQTLNLEFPEPWKDWETSVKQYYIDLIPVGKQILAEKALEKDTNVVVLNPQQRLMNKIQSTIMVDLDFLEDEWMDGKYKSSIELYTKFKSHGLTGSAVEPVKEWVSQHLEEFSDAYSGSCEQAQEAYSHITKPNLKLLIKTCETMLSDLESIKNAAKAVRKSKARVKKPKAADKQVAKLKYCKENMEYKVVSIIPIQIIGSMRLYVFNTKTREITEYVSDSANGFEVKGTTLQGINVELSRKVKLRKPNDFLSIVQSKTPRQIDNEWQKLTTKSSVPNGRINDDCVLLRVLDS